MNIILNVKITDKTHISIQSNSEDITIQSYSTNWKCSIFDLQYRGNDNNNIVILFYQIIKHFNFIKIPIFAYAHMRYSGIRCPLLSRSVLTPSHAYLLLNTKHLCSLSSNAATCGQRFTHYEN